MPVRVKCQYFISKKFSTENFKARRAFTVWKTSATILKCIAAYGGNKIEKITTVFERI